MFLFQVTDDICLQLLEVRHAEELFLLTDKDRNYLREWLPWVDGTKNPGDTRNFIQLSLNGFSNNNGFHAGIFYKDEIAGCIGLHGIDWNNKKTSIGYWLGSDYQGKGIMTQSCEAVINHAFYHLGLNRVEIRAAVLNHKSRAVPSRLGFSHEGIVRSAEWLYDHYVDHVIYGMLSEDWMRRN